MEELPIDQPQYTGEFAQFMLTEVLTTYDVLLRDKFIYSSVSLFRAATFYLPPPPEKETKSQYKHSSYNHVWKT
jgi:hypothetical protein